MSTEQRYDAIIIGGGHNGLVTAAYLARAGMRVVVLERREVLGGAAVTEEIVPGFRFSVASYVVSLLRPEIIRDLDLGRHGLQILPLDGTFTPLDDDYLWRVNDHGTTFRELRRWSLSDAEAYEEYGRLMVHMARFIKPILSVVPPDQGRIHPHEWLSLGPLARSFAELPRRLSDTFIQVMTMSAADFLDQWFETDPLKATMSASGIIGTFQGVRSPGTAYVLLHHYMGEIDGAFRALGHPPRRHRRRQPGHRLGRRALGAEIRTEAAVARIDTADGRVAGVTLESGEELLAGRCAVQRRLAGHVRAAAGAGRARRRVPEPTSRRYKFRGSSAKVNLALAGLPEFSCLPGHGRAPARGDQLQPVGRLHGARLRRRQVRPSVAPPLHRHDHPDAGRPGHGAARPAHDELLRPVRARTTSPTAREWDDAARDALGETVLDTIEERAPGIRKLIVGKQVLTPLDIERRIGLSEGNIFQGELSLEQLFFNRPVPGLGALPHAGRRAVDVRLGRRTPAAG